MINQAHWAESLEPADRCKATIRHSSNGAKNLIDVEVIVVRNRKREREIEAVHGPTPYTIPYNELTKI